MTLLTRVAVGLCMCLLAQTQHASNGKRNEGKLMTDLLADYQKMARPGNDDTPTIVKFGLSLQDVVDVTRLEREATFTLLPWISMEWSDPALSWNELDYGVDSIRLSADEIWTPDIRMYNRLDSKFAFEWGVPFVVYSNGMVSAVSPQHLTMHCPVDSGLGWVCMLKFGSWTYDGLKLDLQLMGDLDLSTYGSQVWTVASANATRNVLRYDCCIEPYIDITYNIGLSQ